MNVPMIAPAIWDLCLKSDGKLEQIGFTTPQGLTGWQHILLNHVMPDGRRFSVAITVLPTGATQLVDCYRSTSALFDNPAAAILYLQDDQRWIDSGISFSF